MKYKIIKRVTNELVGTYDTFEDAWRDLTSFVGAYKLGHGFEYQLLPNDEDELMNVDEAMKHIAISRPSLDLAINDGLPYILSSMRFRMYFKRSELDKYNRRMVKSRIDDPKDEKPKGPTMKEWLEQPDKTEQAVTAKASPTDLLSTTEATEYTGYTKNTITTAVRVGKLKVAKKFGFGSKAAFLFDYRDLDAWVEKMKRNPRNHPRPRKKQTSNSATL